MRLGKPKSRPFEAQAKQDAGAREGPPFLRTVQKGWAPFMADLKIGHYITQERSAFRGGPYKANPRGTQDAGLKARRYDLV
jgi:hypothetical protein